MAKRGRGPQQARRRPAAPPAEAEAPLARAWIATAIWLPAVLAFAAYINALGNPFVYDDARTVVANPSLRDLGNWLFVLVYSRFRPLVNISYALDAAVWGLRPLGFHLTSILLHAANAALVALLAHAWAVDASERAPRSFGVGSERSRWSLAFVAAALFAVHPLLTEAVGYVSGRPEVLCLTFMLIALLLLRRGLRAVGRRRWMAIAGAVLAWILAVLSKETAAVLPIAVFAWDRLLGPGDAGARRRRTWFAHVPILVVIAAGGLARLYFYRSEAGRLPRPLVQHVLTELPILWRYARSLVWPLGQSIVLPAQRVSTPWKPVVIWALLALVVIAVVAWRRRRSQPLVALALLWFPLLLAPSSLIPLVELISEHRMYSASCGLFLVAAALAVGLGERWRAPSEATPLRRWAMPAAAAAVLLALFALTVARNRVWSSNVSLWRDATEKAPLTWAPHYALADALRIENRCQEAIPVYRRALELLPRDVSTLVNLGICEAREGDLGSARVRFETALSLDPSALWAADNLARVEMLAGNDALARQLLEKILHIDPRDTVALVALAELAAKSGDTATVERLCAQARAVAPQAEGVATCGQPAAAGRALGDRMSRVPTALPGTPSYGGLLWTLIRTDFKTRYQGTYGGFVWALLKPLTMFLVLWGVFSFVFPGDPNYKVNLIVGLFLWDFFGEATKVGLASLHAKGYLLTKARFPSWILVVTSAANAVVTLSVFAGGVLLFLAVQGRAPSLAAIGLFVLYLFCFLLIVVGFALAASVLFLRYRDLNQIWEVALQAGFFVAPIVYPLQVLPERLHFVLYLWPPTPVIQFVRAVLVEGTIPSTKAHFLLAGAALAALGCGALVHRLLAPRAAEYL